MSLFYWLQLRESKGVAAVLLLIKIMRIYNFEERLAYIKAEWDIKKKNNEFYKINKIKIISNDIYYFVSLFRQVLYNNLLHYNFRRKKWSFIYSLYDMKSTKIFFKSRRVSKLIDKSVHVVWSLNTKHPKGKTYW